MKAWHLVAVLPALFLSAPAIAATPVLSGTYIVALGEYCWYKSQALIDYNSGTLAFDPTTSTASFTGYVAGGGPPKLDSLSYSGTYSNTSTTLTITPSGGSARTFQIFYGKVTKGIATAATFIGVNNNNDNEPCGTDATLTLN
jgi:hypothetical protein